MVVVDLPDCVAFQDRRPPHLTKIQPLEQICVKLV
jgi:hypothetical protein